MSREEKYTHRILIQAAAEGNLNKLKEICEGLTSYRQLYGDKPFLEEALFYCIRSCSIDCTEYLLSTCKLPLSAIYDDIVWSIISKSGNAQEKRISMFRFLYDKGLKYIPYDVATKYLQLNRKDYFKMTLMEFTEEIDLDEMLKATSENVIAKDRQGILLEIVKEIRSEKIDKILKMK